MEGDKIVHVDMTNMSVSSENLPKEWELLGGRGLSAKILLRDLKNPKCDALGAENVLVVAPGVLSGTSAPTSGRISIGCTSPLTGGIKEANVGGNRDRT
jgi:aldehyde:ferredoxin oxidoreductase